MNNIGLPAFFMVLLLSIAGFSQNRTLKLNVKDFRKSEKDSLDIAESTYEDGFYLSAIPLYKAFHEHHPDELYFTYKLGICYLNTSGDYDKAVAYLEKFNEEKPKTADIKYYLGQAYLLNYEFDAAEEVFNEYLDQNIDLEQRRKTMRFMVNCKVARELAKDSVEVEITNIGKPVNTGASEYVPVITSDESMMLFTYRGEKSLGGKQNNQVQPDPYGVYFEDVYQTEKVDGEWTQPQALGKNINGYGHDACIALAGDGQKLFVYKQTTADMGDIYISELKGEKWSKPERLKGDVNSKSWEGSASLDASGKVLYFSSTRPGGYGGRDLYKAHLQEDGSWKEVENLGAVINTEYNDDAAFIHPDGKYLFFSSEGHKNMGGYDIFYCEKTGEGWSEPVNFGYPVNTTDDDIYYVLTADGKRGYYASGRKGGYGRHDIYLVEPGMFDKDPALVLAKGVVTLDDVPVESDIKISLKNGEEHGDFKSNSATGKFLINLPAGERYTMEFSLEGQDPVIKSINATEVDSFMQRTFDIKFYTDSAGTIAEKQEEKEEKEEESKAPADVPENLDDYTIDQMLEEYGDATADGLKFRVQIAAYNHPENYTYGHLEGMGNVIEVTYDDGITRFTIGPNYRTLEKAYEFCGEVKESGQEDAFVLAIYKGKRTYLKDLVRKGVIKR